MLTEPLADLWLKTKVFIMFIAFELPNLDNISELKIIGGIEDNSQKIFLICQQKHMSCPSLEPSQCDGSNDGSQNMFLRKYG